MVTVPAATPVTSPPPDTVAIEVLPLVHVPPGVASASNTVDATQTLTAPDGVIAAGALVTVTGAVTKHEPIE